MSVQCMSFGHCPLLSINVVELDSRSRVELSMLLSNNVFILFILLSYCGGFGFYLFIYYLFIQNRLSFYFDLIYHTHTQTQLQNH